MEQDLNEVHEEARNPSRGGGNRRYRYRAFISYSHTDRKFARWLMRKLESYRVPKHLVGKASPMGPVPSNLRPIFRDRDELASASDLGERIHSAMAESAALVVICSPAAARSRWVAEEVLAYKRLHGPDRVFCVIIDGDPADAELPAQGRHLLAFQEPGDETESLIHRFTLFPGHPGSPPNAVMCKPCVRNIL